jgi:chromosome segregation ATPase
MSALRGSSTASWFRAHVELLAGRLALQDQRVARLQATADRLRSEIEEARWSTESALARLEQTQEARDSASHEEREYLEDELRGLSSYAKRERSRASELEARWSAALAELEAAESRFEELESYLDQLDRELNRTTR